MNLSGIDPSIAALVTLMNQGAILKRLPRTGWLLNGVAPCETVADHTTGVALLTLGLAGAINAGWRQEGLDGPIDTGRALMMAVLHDLAESVVTDLPKRSAQLLGSENKRRAEADAFDAIFAGALNADDYTTLLAEYNQNTSPEARLVHDADALDMVNQALHYERAGHRTLDEFWHHHRWNYGLCEHLFEVLKLLRK